MRYRQLKCKEVTILLSILIFAIFTSDSYGQSRKLRKIQKSIDKATSNHLVGVAVYIKASEGNEWIGVSGFQDKENRNPIEVGSIIGKMYNAVAALKLIEQGRLQLNDKIGNYLPEWIISNLPNGEVITVRHLLSNQSGLFNYEEDPKLNELYLSGNLKLDTLTHENVLKRYVFNHPPTDFPGTKYHYSSTNFMLLAMIMDHLTPHGHTDFLRKEILQANGFNKTFYRETPPNNLVKHYGDIDKDGRTEDLTMKTIETTNWFIGDDGIYAPISEAANIDRC